MPDTDNTTADGAGTVTDDSAGASDTTAVDLAAALRENAILRAGVDLTSEAGKLLVANPGVSIADVVALSKPAAPAVDATPSAAQVAALQAAQLGQAAPTAQQIADAAAAASSGARADLAAGGTGDTGAQDVHPLVLARQAIEDGVTKQHLSRSEAVALGVAQVMNAAIKGDTRVNYVGRVAPGV